MNMDIKKEFYNRYWEERNNFLNNDEILRLCEILKAITVLLKGNERREGIEICDLGCGRGWLSSELEKFGRVTGVDLSEKGIELAENKYKSISFVVHDITKWRPAKKFDIVVSSEVVEHIENKEQYFETVEYILKPGGYFVLTTPNKKVKQAWDSAGHGGQVVESWLTPAELKIALSPFITMHFQSTFIFDFCYVGIFRFISAPKVIKVIEKLGLKSFYNAILELFQLGLYQIYVGRARKDLNAS